MGVSSDTGSLTIFSTLRTLSAGISICCGDLLGGGLAAVLLHQVARGADHLVDRLDHVDRNADGARLVGDRPADRLPDPPGGVGRELVAALVLELLDRAHEADVPLLDQVEETEAAIGVALGDRDDQAEVGLDEAPLALLRLDLAAPDDLRALPAARRRACRSRARPACTLRRASLDRLAGLRHLGGGRVEHAARHLPRVLLVGPNACRMANDLGAADARSAPRSGGSGTARSRRCDRRP